MFDAQNLATLFLTSPLKFSGRLFQIIGRILRKRKNKYPKVFDVRDNRIRALYITGIKRDIIYRKRWGKDCIKN